MATAVVIGVHGKRSRRGLIGLAELVRGLPAEAFVAANVLLYHELDLIQIPEAEDQGTATAVYHCAAIALIAYAGRDLLRQGDQDLLDLAAFAPGSEDRANRVHFEWRHGVRAVARQDAHPRRVPA